MRMRSYLSVILPAAIVLSMAVSSMAVPPRPQSVKKKALAACGENEVCIDGQGNIIARTARIGAPGSPGAIMLNGSQLANTIPVHSDAPARDAYWDGDPATPQTTPASTCITGTQYQLWNGSGWVNASSAIKGDSGDPGAPGQDGAPGAPGSPGANAPAAQYQYSADGANWHSTWVEGDCYTRISVDGGAAWSSAMRFAGQSDTDLTQITSALRDAGIYPDEIVFTTTGAAFAPVIVLNASAAVEWTFSDGTTSASTAPTASFGTAATRLQRLKVTPWSALYRINVGYQRDDGGASTDALGNTFETVAQQGVSRFQNLHLVKDTLVYLCGSRCPISSVNVRNFTALHTLEFYACGASLTSVDIYGTSNLRRACFENSYVGFLDFSASPLMEDVRGSGCHLREIIWGTTGQHLWHMCVRENSAYLDPATWPSMNQFPVLQDMWISGNGLTGDLVVNSTVIGSAWLYNNNFTSIDLTGAFPGGSHSVTAQNNPNCTSIIINGCPGLRQLDASGCALPQAAVDYLLTSLDGFGASGGALNLSGGTSAAPSATGQTAYNNLIAKGWTVTVNGGADTTAPAIASVSVDGTAWTFGHSEPVRIGAGGSGGLSATMATAGSITFTNVQASGSNVTATGSPAVTAGDTGMAAYTQPGNGIEDLAGNDLASYSGVSVANDQGAASNRLDFSTTGTDPTIEFVITGTATVTVHWADGTTSDSGSITNATFDPVKTLASGDSQAHYATVEPAAALTRLNRDGVQLVSMDGCGNFPSLNYLMFYPNTYMTHLDLTGCTAMREWHLASNTIWPTADLDQAIIDQAAALSGIPDGSITGHFYCPSARRTSASDAARAAIIAKGITWNDDY